MSAVPHATFHLESPAAAEPPSAGRIVARGWLVPAPGRYFVDIRARSGAHLWPGVYGLPCADLAAQFHAPVPHLLAGFEQPLKLEEGTNPIVFEACTLAGEWIAIHSTGIVATSGGASTVHKVPEQPPVRAPEFARALRLLLLQASGEEQPDWATLATGLAAALPHPAAARFAHPPFHGHFDEPAALARAAYGRTHVVGWLFHETEPIRRVFGTFDLQMVQELHPAGAHPGVAARFPQFALAAKCRWEGFVDCPTQLPQPRTLRLFAELADGSWHLCNVQHTLNWDAETDKRPYPRYAAATFLAAAWALHRALRRRQIATDPIQSLVPQLRPVWHAFRTLAPRHGPSMGGLSTDALLPAAESPDPGRILLVTHNLNLEGAPLFLAEYAAACRRTLRAKLLVVSGRDGPLRKRYEQLGAAVQIVDLAPLARATTPATQRRALQSVLAGVDFSTCDLVVANTLVSYWAVHAARAARKPSLLYIHESTTPVAHFHNRPPAALPGIAQALALATRVSFLTAATRRYYTACSDGANYRITPGWIDLRSLDALRTSRPREELRRRLGIAPGERLVVNLGTVCERKGQILFARAVDLLCRRRPEAANVRFLMVGGRDSDYDHDLAGQLALIGRPNLAVVPECEDSAAYYGAADVFVCSSFEESFPRVILEAMAFSLPIVSSAVHGVPEIVRHDEEAVLVPPGDTWALAEALGQLLDQPDWATQLGMRARRRLEQTFTAERVQPMHLELARETAAIRL